MKAAASVFRDDVTGTERLKTKKNIKKENFFVFQQIKNGRKHKLQKYKPNIQIKYHENYIFFHNYLLT